jgi:hypothetical protein
MPWKRNNSRDSTAGTHLSVTVRIGAGLTVTKSSTPFFTRQYFWQISKVVSPIFITAPEGTNQPFNYTVGAAETGFTDSAWQVQGNITVQNPNDFEAIRRGEIMR